MSSRFGPAELLDCYRRGVFPMGETRDDDRLFLIDPDKRGVLPLDDFHVPRRLARTVRADQYRVTADCAFESVMARCGAPRRAGEDTWINAPILDLYAALHRRGHAHSIETWRDGELVGGLYGVALGGAFFGESMFSLARDASKVALVALVARLKAGGFTLLDPQFWSAHLAQFGAVELERAAFRTLLDEALLHTGAFHRLPENLSGDQLLQSIAQTS